MESFETFQWRQLARRQKIYIVAAGVVLVLIIAALGVDKLMRWNEIHKYEAAAAEADRQKEAALKLAADTAAKIKIAEEQLDKKEVQKDVAKDEIKKGDEQLSRSRADYERAVHERLPNVPSTDDLCRQLAAAGHPCNPR